jgi:hypothetical protein
MQGEMPPGALGSRSVAAAPNGVESPADARPTLAPEVGEPAPVVASKAAFKIRHAPVPILMKPRPPVELAPVQEAAAVGPPSSPSPPVSVATDGAAARAAVERDGYRGVKVLRKGDNGVWYAQGMRGSTQVLLVVDAQGNVTSQ